MSFPVDTYFVTPRAPYLILYQLDDSTDVVQFTQTMRRDVNNPTLIAAACTSIALYMREQTTVAGYCRLAGFGVVEIIVDALKASMNPTTDTAGIEFDRNGAMTAIEMGLDAELGASLRNPATVDLVRAACNALAALKSCGMDVFAALNQVRLIKAVVLGRLPPDSKDADLKGWVDSILGEKKSSGCRCTVQ